MPSPVHRIVRAWQDSLNSGVVELDRDWKAARPPQLSFGTQCPAPGGIKPASPLTVGRLYGYYAHGADIAFILPVAQAGADGLRDALYVAGDFNGWQEAVGQDEWRMRLVELEGEKVFLWSGEAAKFFRPAGQRFKFVTGEHQWLSMPGDAPNAVADEGGNRNRLLDATRTGRHLWRFECAQPLDLSEPVIVSWANSSDGSQVPLAPGPFFYKLHSDLPMGALVRSQDTTFRLFAPRAKKVTLFLCEKLDEQEQAREIELQRRSDRHGTAGVWEHQEPRRLHGWYYWYKVDGVREGAGLFHPDQRVLDPYALATVDRAGPGIILDRDWIGHAPRDFKTPAWQDLVMVEAHVRDLVANAPIALSPEERLGFSGLKKWVESPDFYLHRLGVNCVELQPIQEFDNAAREDYHWGYMTTNYFSPESSYALDPAKASGVRELQALVKAFHARGIAVVLDVVYNHVGEPAHLMFVDKLYYFEQNAAGNLSNWSGCGNDLRARSAMAKRLIIDSLIHFVEAYGVDGFRFDLAELLGLDVLREIEVALKRVKPDVILIAEPWSFRGHIAGLLRDTGWASWNDGYRNFLRDFVHGAGDADRLEYFLKGSPWYFAKWPAQTINYTESHDDSSWIDIITEHGNHDALVPTEADRHRTHLMAAVLFMSLGIPLISAGQDFLRSKRGVNNTYQRGDLNALDYRRLYRYLGTHTYFAEWIAFRRSKLGRLLRLFSRPSEGYFQFFRVEGSPALAVLVNADNSHGSSQLLFAVNPTTGDAFIPLAEAVTSGTWRQLANHERFFGAGTSATAPVERELYLPPLGCGLWTRDT